MKPYWIGMCELCGYAFGFSTTYGLVWHCELFDKPMYLVENCNGAIKHKLSKELKGQVGEEGIEPKIEYEKS